MQEVGRRREGIKGPLVVSLGGRELNQARKIVSEHQEMLSVTQMY